jgi:two-component system sensor histidine kinase BarA
VIDQNNAAYATQLKQLQLRNLTLLAMQRKLILLNSNISNELEHIISDVKEINYNIANEFKAMSFKNYEETTNLLNKFYLASLFLVLLFASLLIIFILQLNKSEMLLRQENERSVTMARQKMDLLLHMSHEIRNPLTAIKGFLFVFSKTKLEQKQMEMLNSIRHSSDTLLRTLNDTLDAAKMENSEFKINDEPFNPDLIFKNVIESMEFSSTKKNLKLDYIFNGDKEAIVSGDSFRLTQIMVNLVSNAIKYTAKGGVTIVAELFDTESKLQVDVIDTGAGISLEQQSDLFSKYHQTNSAKGKGGSGLGLFICKQLITLQGGKITVKSKPDEGSTFSFFIPYKKSSLVQTVENKPADPLLLLRGISVLAVDDNEVNLMLLKMMLGKWNVKFFQAINGKEGLDILSKNSISIVLTDLQMPEMDGIELLTAIKKSSVPNISQLPVIVLSGSTEPEDEHKYLKMGFTGVLSKPFTKDQLVNQLVKAIKS